MASHDAPPLVGRLVAKMLANVANDDSSLLDVHIEVDARLVAPNVRTELDGCAVPHDGVVLTEFVDGIVADRWREVEFLRTVGVEEMGLDVPPA